MKDVVRPLLIPLLMAAAAVAAENESTAPPVEPESARSIFNGEDLTGWDGDARLWSVRDRVIRGETTEEDRANGNTFLILQNVTVGDFDLRFSFRCSDSNNSGVQYRSRHITEGNPRNEWVVRGYQHEIRNETELPNVAGFIYDEGGRRGRLCLVGEQAVWEGGEKRVTGRLIDQEEFSKLFQLDDWNDVTIIAKGNRIRHYLNGMKVVDFTDNEPERALTRGIIALQLHAGRPMWVEFKDLRLADLEGP